MLPSLAPVMALPMVTPFRISRPDRSSSQVQAYPTQVGPSAVGSSLQEPKLLQAMSVRAQPETCRPLGLALSDQAFPLGTGQEGVTSELF